MDRAYGYYILELFDGVIELPLKFCMSYAGEESTKTPLRTGVDGRPTNRVFVIAKKGCDKIKTVDDIDRVLEWGDWDQYLNIGTVTKPSLVPIDKFPGLTELLEEDKLKSKERNISIGGIFKKSMVPVCKYNGRHFHTQPHTANCKDNEKHHNIYKILASYLKDNDSFVLCTFYAKGEELGMLYSDDNGILRIAGLYADKDLKPASQVLKFDTTDKFKDLAFKKFDTLVKDELKLVLRWRDFVQKSLEAKGVKSKKTIKSPKSVKKIDEDLIELFENL